MLRGTLSPVRRRISGAVEHPRAVVVLAVATVLVRLVSLTRPPGADESGLLLVARAWAPGGDAVYGRYFVDRPPLLVATYRLGDALGGLTAMRVLAALACGGAVLLAARAGHLVAGRRASGWAALATAAACTNPLIGVGSAKGELLGLPLVLGAVVLALASVRSPSRWRAVGLAAAAGCSGACAIGFKQSLGGGLVFTGVLLLASTVLGRLGPRRLVATIAAALAGAAVPVLLTVLWARVEGVDLDALWYAVVGFRGEASQVLASQPHDAPLTRAGVLVLAALGAGLVLVVGGFVVHAPGEWSDDPSLTTAVAAMLAADTAALVVSGSYWRDYLYALVPSTALAAALLARRRPSRRGTAMRGVVTFTAVSSAVCTLGWVVLQVTAIQPYPSDDTAVALRAAAEPGDTLTVFGGRADVQLGARMPSPYDQLWSLPTRTLDPDLQRLTALVDDPDRPTWLVEWVDFEAWTPEAGARLEAAVRAHYVEHGEACGDRPVWLARGVDRPVVVPDCRGWDSLD
jgi:hypothetical protein